MMKCHVQSLTQSCFAVADPGGGVAGPGGPNTPPPFPGEMTFSVAFYLDLRKTCFVVVDHFTLIQY